MNRIKKALEKCRTYVAVQKFGCGMTGIGHGVEDNILQFLNEADEELARLEKREPTLMSDCISAGLPLDVALKYDVQLFRLTNYVRDKALEELKKGPVGELVLVHRKVLNKLGIDDEVINTVAHTPAEQEPVAWMFQHEETGRTMCVDIVQVEANFEKNNPRLQKICPLYTAPPKAEQEPVGVISESAIGLVKLHSNGACLPFGTQLYAAPVSVEAAVLAEREACAKVCEAKQSYNAMHANTEFAAAIRARSEK